MQGLALHNHLNAIRRKAGVPLKRRSRVPRAAYPQMIETEYADRLISATVARARQHLEPLMRALPGILESAKQSREDSVDFATFSVVVENPQGSIRQWTDSDGTTGQTVMLWDYGYLDGTRGADGDGVDVYVGPDPAPDWIYVVRQMSKASDFTEYDEDKVMLGFDSADSARAAYLAQYDDPRFFGGMTQMSPADFREAMAERRGKAIRHLDSESDYAKRLVEQSKHRLSNLGDVHKIAEEFAHRTNSYQRKQIGDQVRAALGVDVLVKDKGLAAKLQHFTAENVSLISSMQNNLHDHVEKLVMKAITSGTPHDEVAKQIEERFGVGENHARLIARDQIGKLYGQINASRQKSLGVKRFIWRTVGDERVRDEHSDREDESDPDKGGDPYSYDDPPDGELPGEPIQCRCMAEPVFDDVLDDEDKPDDAAADDGESTDGEDDEESTDEADD